MKRRYIIKHIDGREDEYLGKYINRIANGLAHHVLEVGEALYGGRTEPFVYYFPYTGGKYKIYYMDFTSLYPWVQKTQDFPIGQPEKLVGAALPSSLELYEECNKKYFGLVFDRFLPPQDLYIPVLPWRHEEEDGRLIFPFFRKCAENGQETVCEHGEDDREKKRGVLHS